MSKARSLRVALVNPRFDPSFFGFHYALPILDPRKRCWATPGGLPLLAALAPEECSVEIFDENVADIDLDVLRQFDVIGLTGMIVQRARMRELLALVAQLPAIVAVGGPYISVAESAFERLCDVCFIGEADETWPEFLRALGAGLPIGSRYEQRERTNMTLLPVPRLDLLAREGYMVSTVQFSRGCPFECEFCDIITIFGRRPRVKTVPQFIAELEAVRRAGFRTCFLVDDNFIGNKAEAKRLLAEIGDWQRGHRYPLRLTTEASVNLADDGELLSLMVEAGFASVFLGIESPRAESLSETRKFQNTRGDSLLEKVRRIRAAGLVVTAGFIVGFDNDDAQIFEDQYRFIAASGIGEAAVSILAPIPTTPLYNRLAREGRLDDSDAEVAFVPARMTQGELREGHTALLRQLYAPEAFLNRVFDSYQSARPGRARRAHRPVSHRLREKIVATAMAYRLLRALAERRLLRQLVAAYVCIYLARNFGARRMPLHDYVRICAMHFHFYVMMWFDRKMVFAAAAPLLSEKAA